MTLPDSVTVKRASATTDTYGNATTSWASPTTVATVRGRLVQTSSSESPTTDRDAVRTTARLYLPAGTDLRSRDRVTLSGKTWEVSGDPWTPRGSWGVLGLLQADVYRVEG